jgi:hypothetical protein
MIIYISDVRREIREALAQLYADKDAAARSHDFAQGLLSYGGVIALEKLRKKLLEREEK